MEPTLFSSTEFPAGIPLSQFTAAITHAVQSSPALMGAWVIAELSDVRVTGGHCYMELIEKNNLGQTIAKLRATIWRSTFLQLRQKFYSATQRDITTGIKALVRGSINHHSLYGLSFNIIDIDPSYTLGDLERLRREIIMKLQREGVANLNKQLSMPMLPQKIAIISAEGAAGYGDFINHLMKNSEGFVFYPCLFTCAMQGDKVSESIRDALQIIESTADMWDCIAIVRGGGATTDLNGFDDYELARAVATCGLPVVVGIGHERDKNVLDEIANTSLKTPTAVAAFFIDKAREAYEELMARADRLRSLSTDILRGEERRVSSLLSLLPQLALRKLEESKNLLQVFSEKLPLMTIGRLDKENMKLANVRNSLEIYSHNKIEKEELKIQGIKEHLGNLTERNLERNNHKLEGLEALVKVLNPLNTLKRGYSITRLNGKALKSIEDIPPGAILTTMLSDGEIRSQAMVEDLE